MAWQPTSVFLLEESHGWRSLAGYGSWGLKDLDITEVAKHSCTHFSWYFIFTHSECHTTKNYNLLYQWYLQQAKHIIQISNTSVKVLVAQSCPTLCDPMDDSLCPWNSWGKNTGMGTHSFPFPEDLPDPGMEPRSPTLQANSLPSEPIEKPNNSVFFSNTDKFYIYDLE